ncbi:unnamed protein product [Pleuronectes platessa]|uniref:Uncharacterized protein n=1 Tax=Pleuronectes platessa TaxID=8262 RepID=A0A9N7TJK6_PLEPL|nr:unnamed protein product [Pleuronectes platessa]
MLQLHTSSRPPQLVTPPPPDPPTAMHDTHVSRERPLMDVRHDAAPPRQIPPSCTNKPKSRDHSDASTSWSPGLTWLWWLWGGFHATWHQYLYQYQYQYQTRLNVW